MTTCFLKIDLEVYGFKQDKLEYTLLSGPLDYLDSYTYKYESAKALFKQKKEKIFEEIKRSYIREHGLAPTDIELGEKGIYIVKEHKEIRALFQKIMSKGQLYPLENIALSHMLKGSLLNLYKCDKKRELNDANYQSLFSSIFIDTLNNLEKEEIVSYLYQIFMSSPRKFQVIRFLLMNMSQITFDEAYQQFLLAISDGNIVEENKSSNAKVLAYRSPYNDD